jgi:hypothetical protein
VALHDIYMLQPHVHTASTEEGVFTWLLHELKWRFAHQTMCIRSFGPKRPSIFAASPRTCPFSFVSVTVGGCHCSITDSMTILLACGKKISAPPVENRLVPESDNSGSKKMCASLEQNRLASKSDNSLAKMRRCIAWLAALRNAALVHYYCMYGTGIMSSYL